MKTDYRNIKTYEQLRAARVDVRRQIEVSRSGVSSAFSDLKRSFSPVVMMRESMSRFVSSFDASALGASLASYAVNFVEKNIINRFGRRTRLVVFDLDGTLIDTIQDLGQAVNHALELRNLPTHSYAEYKMMVGNGVRNLVKRALPDEYKNDDAYVSGMLADFRPYYTEHIADNSIPYEGISELLEWLVGRGVKVAVASNKFQEGTDILIHKFFPQIPFVSICGNAEGMPLKPDPLVLKNIMSAAGADESVTVMVGDSSTDIKTSKNAGVRGVAVTWGFRPRSELVGADAVVDTVSDLRKELR